MLRHFRRSFLADRVEEVSVALGLMASSCKDNGETDISNVYAMQWPLSLSFTRPLRSPEFWEPMSLKRQDFIYTSPPLHSIVRKRNANYLISVPKHQDSIYIVRRHQLHPKE